MKQEYALKPFPKHETPTQSATGRDLYTGPPAYKASVVPTRSPCSVT